MLGAIGDARMDPRSDPSPHQHADAVTILNRAIIENVTDLCEVGESESDDEGRKGALSSTNDLTHVDGKLAVGRLGRDDGAVAGPRRIRVAASVELAERAMDCDGVQ